MLQGIRNLFNSWIALVILGILTTAAFLLFGIEGYFSLNSSADVATVGKQSISQQDFQNRMNQLRQQAQIDPDQFDKPEFRRQVLDGMINQKLLLAANQDLGVVVPKAAIAGEIASIPAFQLNGKFDADTYTAVLGQQGMTPLGFQAKVKSDLEIRVLPTMVQQSALATSYQVDRYLALRDQTRDVRYIDIPAPATSSEEPTAKDIAAYYKAHQADFMNPETVSLNYIELKADNMKTDVVPDDAAIKARYERDKHRFVTPEQRLVSHILVSVPANATPEQQKAALAKADKIEQQLKSGADFATLAKQDSDDLGSKRQGGDLGWIEPGVTDKAFNDALFAMKKGAVSKPVLSPEGYHIIWLRDVREGHTKPLAEVKDEITKELLGSERERAYNDEAGRLTDLLYSNPTGLQAAVDKLGLKIQQTKPFTRDGAATGIGANKNVVTAAFSDQVLVRGLNSDPINLGADDMVVIHINQHKPATPKPLAEVTATIRQRIIDDRLEQSAKKRADGLLAKVRKGESLDKVAAGLKLTVKQVDGLGRFGGKLLPKLTSEVFKMPHPTKKSPSSALVGLGHGDYTLVVLDAVHPGDASKAADAERKAIATQLQQRHGDAEFRGLIGVLRDHADIKINTENLANNSALQ